jgi:Flp pilus assembly protein TadD
MQENAVESNRRLLPRWRSLARTPPCESLLSKKSSLGSSNRKNNVAHSTLQRWQETGQLIDAAEVVDAALVTGNYLIARPAAQQIVDDSNAVRGLQSAARQILGHTGDRPISQLTPSEEWDSAKIRKSVAYLKDRLRMLPRDALCALEIARLQSVIGQKKSASKYVEWAVAASPNDRYILRSAARFWSHDGDHQRALDAIWASDVVRVDPWVQAVEASVASICGKTPRWATKAIKEIITKGPSSIRYSELASSLATLELHAGAPKKHIRTLLKISLAVPTENALAQAIWTRKNVGLQFNFSEHLEKTPNANEARARAAYESQDYAASAEECWLWLQDENFSSRAAMSGAFICLSLLGQYEQALRFSERGLRANPNNGSLINNRIVALALSGRVAEAAKMLSQLDAFEADREFEPFVRAARGLVAFREGDFSNGRHFYRLAIESCKESSRPALAANAMIYWLEQELFAGTISVHEAENIMAKLDAGYSKKNLGDEPVWPARRKIIILPLMAQLVMREGILRGDQQLEDEKDALVS